MTNNASACKDTVERILKKYVSIKKQSIMSLLKLITFEF